MSDCCDRTKKSHGADCADFWEELFHSAFRRTEAAEKALAALKDGMEKVATVEGTIHLAIVDADKLAAMEKALAEAVKERSNLSESLMNLQGMFDEVVKARNEALRAGSSLKTLAEDANAMARESEQYRKEAMNAGYAQGVENTERAAIKRIDALESALLAMTKERDIYRSQAAQFHENYVTAWNKYAEAGNSPQSSREEVRALREALVKLLVIVVGHNCEKCDHANNAPSDECQMEQMIRAALSPAPSAPSEVKP